jgi:SAM-dependent methyltransferase
MPTDWEAQYQKGETPWDKGAPCPGLLDHLAAERVAGKVLVPGCGTGHDVRALAGQGAEVVGLDLAPSAIATAQRFPAAGRETYELGNLFELAAHLRGAFDCVWEHTCFCAIDPSMRADYVRSVHAALRPDGNLLAIFYLDPGNASPDEGPPFEVSIAELDRLFLPHFDLLQEWLPQNAYPGREGREWMRLMRKR